MAFNQDEVRKSLTDLFPRFCECGTGSVESDKVPSTESQRAFAEGLADMAKHWGYQADMLPFGLRIRAPATISGVEPIAFGAHIDTTDDAPNENVRVLVHQNYDGGDIVLPNKPKGKEAEGSIVISPRFYPGLTQRVGDTIYTSDGSTLLGADDKAGIAEIMTFLKLAARDQTPHGEIDALFTYDEETGLEGACKLNPKTDTNATAIYVFDADYGELGIGSFNAAKALLPLQKVDLGRIVHGSVGTIKIAGIGAFPGYGKSKGMIDAFQTLPAVVKRLDMVQIPIIDIRGNTGGLELDVILGENGFEVLENITDPRFSDHRREHPLATSTANAQPVTTLQGYDLSSLVKLVEGIPYAMSAEQTDGLQGYVQPYNITAKAGQDPVVMTLLRNFETDGLAVQKELVRGLVPGIQIVDQYMNKRDVLAQTPHVIQIARQAMIDAGVAEVRQLCVRGGDESGVYTLSIETMSGQPEPGKRVPAVNVHAFDDGFHTVCEHASLRTMVAAVNTIYYIVQAHVARRKAA